MAGGLAGLPAAAWGAPPWSVPVDLSTPGARLPSDPAVAVTPRGRAVVSWWRPVVLQVRTRASWRAAFIGPRLLSRLPGGGTSQPVVTVAGDRALVGWPENAAAPGGVAIGLRALSSKGVPRPLTRIEEGAARVTDVGVGIAPSGQAVAVWTRDPFPVTPVGDDTVVRVATRSADGVWTPAGDLSPPGATDPAVAVAPDGSSIVVWERGGVVEAALGDPRGAFVAPVTVSPTGAPAEVPTVAMDAAGDALVAWYQDGVRVADRPAGGAFSAPRTLSAPDGFPRALARSPVALALTDGGRAVAAWRRRSTGPLRVEGAIRPAGGDWAAAVVLSPLAARNAGRPALGASAAGHAVVAWSQPIGSSLAAIRARALPRAGVAFGPLEAVSTAAGRGTAPSVGLDGRGRAVLAWREDPIRGPGRFFRAAVRFSPG